MGAANQNLYAVLGLEPGCADADIRMAYRALAKAHHPDVTRATPEAMARIQDINHAYATLGDPVRRRAYDAEREKASSGTGQRSSRFKIPDIKKDLFVTLEELIRGTTLRLEVRDPANHLAPENYEVEIAPESAPGQRLRLPRTGSLSAGFVLVRVKLRPGSRFKVRGFDLQCELRIQSGRAASGGNEFLPGPRGNRLSVTIPPAISRGETIRIPGEGLTKPRGGRGDLLVRIIYRPEVTISRHPKVPAQSPQRRRLIKG